MRVRPPRPWGSSLIDVVAVTALLLWGCDPVPYDFGEVGGDTGTGEPDGALCQDVAPSEGQCLEPGDPGAGCVGGAVVGAVQVGESLGCSSIGMSLGVVEIASLYEPVDLFAWSGGGEEIGLSVFRDPCGQEPFGAQMECGHGNWIFAADLDGTQEIYLHVRADAGGDVPVEYQLVGSGAWNQPLPPPQDPISCDLVSGGYLSDGLIFPNPVEGGEAAVDFFLMPPAISGSRVCGAGGLGRRQAAYLMRNPLDHAVHVSGVDLRTGAGDPVPFNFGFFRCSALGEVAPGQAAASMGCLEEAQDQGAGADLDMEPWDGGPQTQYVLVLQVSAEAHEPLELSLSVD